ncbi:phosphotransferase family protein [Haloarchaeobius sp. DFWS5]|uniref:phosphotransferase family protein n=1 Tax=Haloarchaeobius sp. DFWS5 TaxID=3446114 RepID=UPI003EB6F4DA
MPELPDEEFTDDEVVGAVATAFDCDVRSHRPADEGTDKVSFVTLTDGREVVLKAPALVDPARFRPEPRLMRLVGRETDVPVPEIFHIGEGGPVDGPWFAMERRDGENWENRAGGFPDEAHERLCREAGRNLGQLYRIDHFDGIGMVGVRDDDLVIDVEDDDWRSGFEELVSTRLDRMEEHRFADLIPACRDHLDSVLSHVPREVHPAPAHTDYRLGNLLVEPDAPADEPVTRAVLDWGNTYTAHGEFDLVSTEDFLFGWTGLSDDRKATLREALHEGYSATSGTTFDEAFWTRWRAYKFATRLAGMEGVPYWYEDGSEEQEAMGARHRQYLAENYGIE